jgi:hypothetical protein
MGNAASETVLMAMSSRSWDTRKYGAKGTRTRVSTYQHHVIAELGAYKFHVRDIVYSTREGDGTWYRTCVRMGIVRGVGMETHL